MIANFDDFLGSHRIALATFLPDLAGPTEPSLASALAVCERSRDCLIRAAKAVAQLARAAGDNLSLRQVEQLRGLLASLWESRDIVEQRIAELRRLQSEKPAPSSGD